MGWLEKAEKAGERGCEGCGRQSKTFLYYYNFRQSGNIRFE
jgi:hypothetical protein